MNLTPGRQPAAFATCRWRKTHEFVLAVYKFTTGFPKQETYGLASQMRRAAVSVPANITEGFRRRGRADKARFMNLAEGSLEECRYYLILAQDLQFRDTAALAKAAEEVSCLLGAYAAAILTSDFVFGLPRIPANPEKHRRQRPLHIEVLAGRSLKVEQLRPAAKLEMADAYVECRFPFV
jgi:four helix bundle protein